MTVWMFIKVILLIIFKALAGIALGLVIFALISVAVVLIVVAIDTYKLYTGK